ncbi:MAG: major facilitator superfamily domain-containing protein 7 [Chloroflexi bacterium]|nr:major facilitator superfamily domain-containing protein 7 [Chloroflexota bacterium]MBM3172709.1 major facilitator superfamily domain-containing protein 7 [Chloroflexota bacterium]MBM4449261.1 major facilitator superfamily domain-containing protein 7 [Chloroflexota bacterium]
MKVARSKMEDKARNLQLATNDFLLTTTADLKVLYYTRFVQHNAVRGETMESYKVYGYRWVVLAVYMYLCALTQLYWLNFAAIDTYLEARLNITAMSVGVLTLVFPLVQVLLTIPAGMVIDRKGFKYGVGIGALFTGIFAMLRLVNPGSYTILLVSQIGISMGQPFVLNGVTKLAMTWFPQKEEATAVGLGSLALFIGMMVALGATPILVESFSFGTMLMVYGILGIVGILLFYALVKSKPETAPREVVEEEEISNWAGIKTILKMRDFVILGFVALIGIGVFNGLATWLEKILNELHGISMTDAGTIAAVLILSGMLGCIIIPIVSDKVMKRKPFLLLASSVGALSIVFLMLAKGFALNMVNGVVLGFFLISALPIMLTMSAEITGARFAGISVGYLQLLGNAAAVAIVPLMEVMRGATQHYAWPLAFLAILLGVSFVLATQIKETMRR